MDILDTSNADHVLDFAYDYLARCALPPTDQEVRNVTRFLAQWAGRVVPRATVESLLGAR
jgi:hypothetical protein